MNVLQKVEKLRNAMKDKGIDAYIIPSNDPHISEYVPKRWTSRQWISGFTGSAGTIVITQEDAGLWTDSRYFIQAAEELKGSGITLHKAGNPGVDDYPDWLNKNMDKKAKVGIDGKVLPVSMMKSLKQKFELKQIQIVTEFDLLDEIWEDRQDIPMNELFIQPIQFAGQSRAEKLMHIREEMKEKLANVHLVCTLDDIAWIFNIRGHDVDFNPVVVSYALITESEAVLYIKKDKIPENAMKELKDDGVSVKDYYDIEDDLKKLDAGNNMLLDPSKCNAWLYGSIPGDVKIIEDMNISTLLKAVKNDTEIKGMTNALKRDCVAMTRFIKWLEDNIGKKRITELSASEKLTGFRKEIDLFEGESFNTISGYAGHGAIVHYSVDKNSDVEIGTDTFYLCDSGGQYIDGTTDITRTLHFGKPSEEEKRDYTLVLKGHIQLAMAKFPEGTRGAQIDALARKPLWDHGMSYDHGTGHGVGCFLNVHEGPQNIRKEENPVILKNGMFQSNEPGVYKQDKYGIRIENLIVVDNDEKTDFGQFHNFRTLTLCPIETKAIDKSLLTEAEIKWLNDYHQMVYNEVKDLIEDDDLKKYLKEKTKAV